MSIALFLTLFTILSLVDSLTTEAVKRTIGTDRPTIVAAVLAAIIGWGGGICAYILLGIIFTPATVVCLILMAPAIWLGATTGFDKVKELIEQIGIII